MVLTLDVGSSSVRSMLSDRQGRAVKGIKVREQYWLETPETGAAEIKPDVLLARVLAEQVGNAVVFFANNQTPTTGATIPVDGGIPGAFPR